MNASLRRVDWRRIDGVLLLDKPHGIESNAALQAVRRLYRAEKAGHAGTLDPLATGLLPILFGEATKFGGVLLNGDKRYDAEITLGMTTTTGDAEGDVVERRTVGVSRHDVERVARRFVGQIAQVPPMYSALKRGGRPLYAYARAGVVLERAPRNVAVYELQVLAFEGDRLAITVRCGKGTYIRVLAEDIGQALGCGAHLAGLRRTAVGRFAITDAVAFASLEALSDAERDARLQPIYALVLELPVVRLDSVAARRFTQGQAVDAQSDCRGMVRVHGQDGAFVGTGEMDASGELRPRRLVRQGE